jgi:imidazolonepropionase-like amidohydrolase/ABC-type multidrug transport system permease subunit
MLRAYIALFKIDMKLAFRAKSVLFFNYFFPLLFFFIFGQLYNADQGSVIFQVVSMVTALGILGNGLYGAGMRAVQERETNVLRRYKVTPISPLPLLISSMMSGLVIYIPALVGTIVLAMVVYAMKLPSNMLSFFLFACLGCLAFRAIGLIVSSVVNSMQESMILIQPLYMAMLFLSGITIPVTLFPLWLQSVVEFVPAKYLMTGLGGILQRGESFAHNWLSATAMLITGVIGIFLATKLFRWEKEEKLKASAKLWVLVVLFPFIVLGAWEAHTKEDQHKSKVLMRDLERGQTALIRNARIFTGTGKVIETGAVLVRDGKVAQIFEGASPEAKDLKAEAIDAAGKTLLPGLVDVHIHFGSTGGFYDDMSKFDMDKSDQHEFEAYLYSGVTAVRSAGDQLKDGLHYRELFNSGEKLGPEIFICGPLFTAEKGHGTEYAGYMPEAVRAGFNAQFLRMPRNVDEARSMVDALAAKKVNAIKGILDEGAEGHPFQRMEIGILRTVVDEAHRKGLPASIHTGRSADVIDAVAIGANSIEHGSYVDDIPDATLAEMKARGIAFDPTLSVVEGMTNFAAGNATILNNSLVQQVTPQELIIGTRHAAMSPEMAETRQAIGKYPMSLEQGSRNLVRAWKAGVMLVTGSDAGNFLVMHGPTVQREVELWVAAGIPIPVALQAATANGAKLLGAGNRFGTIEKGKEATFLLVDGNPLQDVKALSNISMVMLKGERVGRSGLFDQK